MATTHTILDHDTALLRRLVDSLPTMIAYWDASLRCQFVSRAVERWFGVKPEEVIGRRPEELLSPEQYRLVQPYIERAIAGEMQEFGRDIPDPSGGPDRHGVATYIPHIVHGELQGCFTMLHDVSSAHRSRLELEEAHERIRESEERFRLTIDEAPIGMALVDPEGRPVRVNRVLCQILGYSPEELIKLTFRDFTHPDDVDADVALFTQLAAGKIPRYQMEKRYLRKDGTIVDAMLSVSAVRGTSGSPLYFVGQVEDVTERKRHEREQRFLAELGLALAKSLDQEVVLKRMAELATGFLADWCIIELADEEGPEHLMHIAHRDPAKAPLVAEFERLKRARQPTGPAWWERVKEKPYLREVVTECELQEAALDAWHLELFHQLQIESLIAMPLNARGRRMGVLTLVSSSRSHRYGPGDLRLAEELARRAALSIDNARLYRAAQEASRLRDEVLAVVAHDLRNPVHRILLEVGLLRREGPARAPRSAERIERTAKQMNHLIEDLLDVSRMEAGRLPLERGRLQPAELIRESVDAQRPLATAASLELRTEFPATLPEICADRDRLLQVFENLFGNALKFTRPGGRITVGAMPRDGQVLFWVADSGIGIPADGLPHVFDRFWQAKKGERLGAGLGLPIVKGIIQAHGGRIWVESTLGVGTRFFFTLPAIARPEAQMPAHA